MRAVLFALALLIGCSSDGVQDDTGGSATGTNTGTGTGNATGTGTGTGTSTGGTTPSGVTLQLGNGETEHLPVQDGDSVIMVVGGQGAGHIEVSGLVTNTGAAVSIGARVIHVATGTQLAGDVPNAFVQLAGWDIAEKQGFFAGHRAVFDPEDWLSSELYCNYEGEELELCVHVADLGQPSLQVERCVRVIGVLTAEFSEKCANP